MKSFYSILYIEPEPVSEEKISVGLFLNADRKPMFDYSEDKLKIASNLIGSETADSLERVLRNIKKKAKSISGDEKQAEAFDVKPFSESYFKYLNNYSNNLITYSDPSKNHGDFALSDYKELFRLLVDKKYGIEEKKEESFKTSVKKKIKSSIVKDKMDIFYKVPKESVETIYRDHIVDYIGFNGSIISGNSIDMKGDTYNLENKFYLLKSLANGLLELSDNLNLDNNGKHVVFYNEPEENKNKDLLHRALNDDSSPLTLKHWGYFEEEEDWIANAPIKKFSELAELI